MAGRIEDTHIFLLLPSHLLVSHFTYRSFPLVLEEDGAGGGAGKCAGGREQGWCNVACGEERCCGRGIKERSSDRHGWSSECHDGHGCSCRERHNSGVGGKEKIRHNCCRRRECGRLVYGCVMHTEENTELRRSTRARRSNVRYNESTWAVNGRPMSELGERPIGILLYKRLDEMEDRIRPDTKQEILGVKSAIELWKPVIESGRIGSGTTSCFGSWGFRPGICSRDIVYASECAGFWFCEWGISGTTVQSPNYFDVCNTFPGLWVRVATIYFRGRASSWLRSSQAHLKFPEWNSFCGAVVQKFDRDQHQQLIRQMDTIKQNGSVTEFYESFDELMNQLLIYDPVDSGSTVSFLSSEIATKIPGVEPLAHPVKVKVANGEIMECQSTIPQCEWSTQGHVFTTNLRVISLGGYDMILGMDWLSQHSPMSIDWAHKTLALSKSDGTLNLQGIVSELTQCKVVTVNQIHQLQTHTAVAHLVQLWKSAQLTVDETIPSEVQDVLKEFEAVFQEPKGLPPPRQYDHTIPLIPGAQPVNICHAQKFLTRISELNCVLNPCPGPARVHKKTMLIT
uniref:Retrotransposon gag domain-containing protein n=1 Tax=Oryza brachyantha TaxID=4533 RepID=J3MDG5_ORYBR